jgi:hypothetical protein
VALHISTSGLDSAHSPDLCYVRLVVTSNVSKSPILVESGFSLLDSYQHPLSKDVPAPADPVGTLSLSRPRCCDGYLNRAHFEHIVSAQSDWYSNVRRIQGHFRFRIRADRCGRTRTDRILRTLVITSLNSGAWPAVFATLALILVCGFLCANRCISVLTRLQAALLPHALWYTALAYPAVQLYGNSVLGNLNARVALRRADNAAPFLGSYSFPTRGGARGTVSKPRSADRSVSCSTFARRPKG